WPPRRVGGDLVPHGLDGLVRQFVDVLEELGEYSRAFGADRVRAAECSRAECSGHDRMISGGSLSVNGPGHVRDGRCAARTIPSSHLGFPCPMCALSGGFYGEGPAPEHRSVVTARGGADAARAQEAGCWRFTILPSASAASPPWGVSASRSAAAKWWGSSDRTAPASRRCSTPGPAATTPTGAPSATRAATCWRCRRTRSPPSASPAPSRTSGSSRGCPC